MESLSNLSKISKCTGYFDKNFDLIFEDDIVECRYRLNQNEKTFSAPVKFDSAGFYIINDYLTKSHFNLWLYFARVTAASDGRWLYRIINIERMEK